ncbi:DUF2182 domain-containing protein [Pseudomonas sp. St316]|uniref:copper chaperone n=1 Tax=Pseudomonas sp. St316 TaxID=2678257 RepID=UPI002017FB7E|nr:DUF2182 domain-containing protein [Pseudomonas sp. St316]
MALSVYNDITTNGPAFCVTVDGLSIFTSWSAALQAELALNPPQRILAGWALMLLAMMPPLLATPLIHVWRSSLPSRRIQASVGFLLGYGAMWMAAGPLLIALALLLQMATAENALAVALLVAMLWSASPWHRAALNRGHRMGRLSLFGWAVNRDCLIRGLAHGLFCIVSCWAWMVVPLVSGSWHIPMMLLTGAVLLAERLIAAKTPRWN